MPTHYICGYCTNLNSGFPYRYKVESPLWIRTIPPLSCNVRSL